MSSYEAQVHWQRTKDENYIDNKYSRGHKWIFDGGTTVNASSSPHIVPLAYSVEENVDPEEAFIASLSSCHMLIFLSIAAKKKYTVDSYTDNAIGTLANDSDGNISMTEVRLRPHVKFSGDSSPTRKTLEKMHHLAHKECFIANSVKTEVTTEIITETNT